MLFVGLWGSEAGMWEGMDARTQATRMCLERFLTQTPFKLIKALLLHHRG